MISECHCYQCNRSEKDRHGKKAPSRASRDHDQRVSACWRVESTGDLHRHDCKANSKTHCKRMRAKKSQDRQSHKGRDQMAPNDIPRLRKWALWQRKKEDATGTKRSNKQKPAKRLCDLSKEIHGDEATQPGNCGGRGFLTQPSREHRHRRRFFVIGGQSVSSR